MTGGSRRPIWHGVALVAGFWWFATGLIFALQRNATTRLVAMLLFSGLAVAAVWAIRWSRHERSPRAMAAAFLGGGALWAWVTNALFGWWVVGPAGVTATVPGPSWALAGQAIHATLYNDLASVGLLVAVWLAVRRSTNALAATTLLILWASQQVAKVNIFLGVANPGARFLPEPLAFLAGFFGPESNSPFLYFSVLVALATAAWTGRRVRHATDDATRLERSIIASLLGLAAVEYLVLGLRLNLPLWDLFLALRGS